ncbi:hypothetical protein [Amycolatopsis sp. w19]
MNTVRSVRAAAPHHEEIRLRVNLRSVAGTSTAPGGRAPVTRASSFRP